MLDSELQQNSNRQKLTIPNPSDSTVQQNSKRQKLMDVSRGASSREALQQSQQTMVDENGCHSDAVDTVHCADSGIAAETATDNIENVGSGVSQQEHGRGTGIRNERDFENLICIEIFSGSGRLTAAIRKIGMRSVAIDRSSQRTSGPVSILDLTKKDDLQYLLNFIKSEKDNIMLVHLAPPCGTASAARNRRHKALEEAGFELPAPLRSKEFPMGLPSLRGLDATKVESANRLYEATYIVAELCIQMGITVSVENPQNSLFWDTDPIRKLLQLCPGHCNVFDSCMMGGDRDKATMWWCSDDLFESFNLRCNKLHEHKSWTPTITSTGLHFPTATEASYPELLCERVAHLVQDKAERLGFCKFSSLVEQSKKKTSSALQHVNMGFLPRGHKVKPLVSEFGSYKTWIFQPSHNIDDIDVVLKNLPKGTRIVNRKLVSWGDVRVCKWDGTSLTDESGKMEADKVEKITFGLPREPSDFVAEAVKAGHPRFLEYRAFEAIDNLVGANLCSDTYKVIRRRLDFLRKWTARAAELKKDEKALHQKLDPHCSAVLKGKRLLVFGEMLKQIGYPDTHLVSDICHGFRITGWVRDSGCFVRLPKQPSMTLKHLLGMTRGLNEAVLAKAAGSHETDLVSAAWSETMEELEKKWIWRDDSKTFAGLSLTHRFGLQQKKKVRVIDNFKTSGVNATCGMQEKQKLFGLDFLATTLVRALNNHEAKCGLQGKTFDLSAAYKQFPIHGEDRKVIRIAVPVPGKSECQVFGVNALPFGATGSVAGFLRVSTAVFHLLTLGMEVWAGTFFDDFPILSKPEVANQTEQHVSHLLNLIGLRFSSEGKKWLPFDESMAVLGVILDLERFAEGVVSFKHTEARRSELEETLNRHLESDALSQKDAESLRGRLIWFESFLFGRIANLSLHKIGKRATALGHGHKLNDRLRRALVFFRDRIVNGRPIEITKAVGKTMYIFTDGAFEPSSSTPGTLGGILYNEYGVPINFFSEVVPDRLMEAYLHTSKNPIYLIELLAVFVAIRLWGEACKNNFVVNFVDNEASRSALIKAWSDTALANNIIRLYVDDEMEHGWKPWFGRVPSHSNPADDPSRLVTDHLLQAGVARNVFTWNDVLDGLVVGAHGGEMG